MSEKNETDPTTKENQKTLFKILGVFFIVAILGFSFYSYMNQGTVPIFVSEQECTCAKQFGWECDVQPLYVSSVMMDNRINLNNCAPVNPCNLTADRLKELRVGGCVYGNSSLEVTIRPPSNQNKTKNTSFGGNL